MGEYDVVIDSGLACFAQSAGGKWPSEEKGKYERETQRSTFNTFEPRGPFRMTLVSHDDPHEVCCRASTDGESSHIFQEGP